MIFLFKKLALQFGNGKFKQMQLKFFFPVLAWIDLSLFFLQLQFSPQLDEVLELNPRQVFAQLVHI